MLGGVGSGLLDSHRYPMGGHMVGFIHSDT